MTIKDFVNKNKSDMINNLIELVNIPTLRGEPAIDAPFGVDVNRGLHYVLDLAQTLGIDVKNYDGYAGEINLGTGDYIIGILCHVDVVPVGDGWNTDPFDAQIIDNKIYGRGSMDDKSPIISCLYALSYLKENNLVPDDITYRMIIGTNEEEDWLCIKHYTEVVDRLPDISIVPDANFPAIFCEKGCLDFNLYYKVPTISNDKMKINLLEGGIARNIVTEKAQCVIETFTDENDQVLSSLNTLDGVSSTQNGNLWTIKTLGKSCHAMSPEKGKNATAILMDALGKLGEAFPIKDFVEIYNNHIGFTYNGEHFNCAFEDQVSGKLTFNVGQILLADNLISLISNIRYPASCDKEKVFEAVQSQAKALNFEYEQTDHMDSICIDPNSELITKLMSAYVKETGDTINKPFSIGGATYARTIPNAVAFGPLFPWEEELAHEDNEFQDIESFEKMTYIYADALELLGHRSK